MSEFRIVKCKKCNASLTELEGEKLRKCVQCGYQFSINTKQSGNAITRKLDSTPELTTLLSKLRQLKTQKLSHETGTIHTSRTKTKNITKSEKTPLKKSNKPIWFSILKWYVIISIFTGILSSFFR